MLSRPAGMSRRVVVVEAGRVVGIVTGAELVPILSR
jgi:CBS domain-containing protein